MSASLLSQKQHYTLLPGKTGLTLLLCQPSFLIYCSSATSISSLSELSKDTRLPSGQCFQETEIAKMFHIATKQAQNMASMQCLFLISSHEAMVIQVCSCLMMLKSEEGCTICAHDLLREEDDKNK